MKPSTRLRSLALAPLLAAAVLLPQASAAHSADPLTVEPMDCTSTGGAHFTCSVLFSGGTAPYTVDWQAYNDSITQTWNSWDGSAVAGDCVLGQSGRNTATVRDAAGQSVTVTGRFTCRWYAP